MRKRHRLIACIFLLSSLLPVAGASASSEGERYGLGEPEPLETVVLAQHHAPVEAPAPIEPEASAAPAAAPAAPAPTVLPPFRIRIAGTPETAPKESAVSSTGLRYRLSAP